MKNYKIILTLWFAFGVSISGYFFINPPEKNVELMSEYERECRNQNIYIGDGDYYKFSILATSIGAILIFGFGKYYKKQ